MVRNAKQSGGVKKVTKERDVEYEKCSRQLEQLTGLCSAEMPSLGTATLQYYQEILKLLEEVRLRQTAVSSKFFSAGKDEDPQMKLSSFLSWANANGIESPNVSVTRFPPPYDWGLVATGPICPGDMVVSVPQEVVMTAESLAKEYDGVTSAFKMDPILSGMANVALAFQLLCERQKMFDGRRSRWQDYIRLLPDSFGTPMFFSLAEVEMFSRIPDGGVTMAEVVKLNRAIIRQYGYFHQLLRQKSHNFAGLPVNGENFCFDAYRWAVGVVMTRMNLVPSGKDGSFTPALIPFWDLANHSGDGFSTDWTNSKIDCRATHECPVGQQIFLFYGERPNDQFLLHNGFFYPGNCHSVATVRLGLSRSDPLLAPKMKKLAELGIQPHYDLKVSRSSPLFEPVGLQFVRVFLASSQADLDNLDQTVSVAAVLSFLLTRLKLLASQSSRSKLELEKIRSETDSQNVRNVLSLALEWGDVILTAQNLVESELVKIPPLNQ